MGSTEDYAPLVLVYAQKELSDHTVFAEEKMSDAAKPQAANKMGFHTVRQMGPEPGVGPLAA